MALKAVYVIDDERWSPLGRAAALLGTSTAKVKQWMGEGTLDWRQLRPGSKNLLVGEQGVLRRRLERRVAERERVARADKATRTADQRGRSMGKAAAEQRATGRAGAGVFGPTWDPAPVAAPISGRMPKEGTRE